MVGLLVLHVHWAVLSLPVSGTFQERHGTTYIQAGPIDMTGRAQDKASCIHKKKVLIYAIEELNGFVTGDQASERVAVVAIWRT